MNFLQESLKYPLHVWHVLTKPRPHKWKIGIMFPATLFANMLSMGISSVITLYVLNSPFCLPSIQVGYFTGTRFMVLGVGAALGIKLLRIWFPQHIISMFGIFSYAAFYTTLSFARTEAVLYVGELISTKRFRGDRGRLRVPTAGGQGFPLRANLCIHLFLHRDRVWSLNSFPEERRLIY